MTLRAALYARFSTDNQSAASIPDQLRACRRKAEQMGAEVVETFEDEAISGWSMGNRPGVRALMAACDSGRVDLVIAAHSNRLARSGSSSWEIWEDLRALGVGYHTVAEGEVTAMHVGMGSTVSVMQIEDGRRRTRDGLEGVVRDGRSAGGLCYGYRVRRELDARGEPIRGLREIEPDAAAVVVRIFEAYAAGMSPRAIAGRLNDEGVAGPSGGAWNASTIHGNARRGNGVLHNELYRGVIVWGRHAWTKTRRTGRRRARDGEPGAIVRQDVPELRIVPEPLWQLVRDRHAEATRPGRPAGERRPKKLLSGLIRCGDCGSNMTLSGPNGTLRCHARVERGAAACANTRTPAYAGVEARVTAAIKANLLHPAVIEAAVREHQAEAARLAKGRRSRTLELEKALAEVKRRQARLVDQVAAGEMTGRQVRAQLDGLDADEDRLLAEIADEAATAGDRVNVVEIPRAAVAFRRLVEGLEAALASPATVEAQAAWSAVRALITAVVVIPLPARGCYALEIAGDLAPILTLGRTQQSPPGQGQGGCDLRLAMGAGARSMRCPNILPFRLAA